MTHLRLASIALVLVAGCGGSNYYHYYPPADGGTPPVDLSGVNRNPDIMNNGCTGELVRCNGVCTDITSDARNCGTCGHACLTGESCQFGSCVSGCTMTLCSGLCVDTTADSNNCGGCGRVCQTGQTCQSSVCRSSCVGIQCNGICVDPTTDNNNCGACGRVCQTGTTCKNSLCTTVAVKTGCSGYNQCLGTCAAGDNACLMACAANATTQAISLFNATVMCVQGICPSTAMTDPCNMSNPNYATTCQACINMSIGAGGPCASQWNACMANTP
jgi:hypothetical protein